MPRRAGRSLVGGGAWAEALDASVAAADAASAVFAFSEALEQYERALAAWELTPTPPTVG